MAVNAITVEIRVGDVWTDISSDVKYDGGKGITITRGGNDEQTNPPSANCKFTLKNAHKYAPKNPLGPYYGSIGRNTPMRTYVTPHYTSGSGMDVTDTFTRTLATGWGTSDSGVVWDGFYAGAPYAATDFSVNGSQGLLSMPVAVSWRNLQLTAINVEDVDVTASVRMNINPVTGGNIEPGGILVRARNNQATYYFMRFEVAPSGAVTARIMLNDSTTIASAAVPGITWSGQTINMRARVIGNWLAFRVWDPAAGAEPTAWSVETYDSTLELNGIPAKGTVGVRSGVGAGNSNAKPIVAAWDNIVVTPIFTRFCGEISQWPVVPDTSGTIADMHLQANDYLRRGGQSDNRPLSPLGKSMVRNAAIHLWPMTDGTSATTFGNAIAFNQPLVGNTTVLPKFSSVAGPPGAPESLPQLVLPAVAPTWTDYMQAALPTAGRSNDWTVDFIANLGTESIGSFPYANLLNWAGGTTNYTVYASASGATWSLWFAAYNTITAASTYIGANVTVLDGKWHYFRATCEYVSSTTITITLYMDDVLLATNTIAGFNSGPLNLMAIYDSDTSYMKSISVGYISTYDGLTVPSNYAAVDGYSGESIFTRITRLSTYGDIGCTTVDYDSVAPTLGAEPVTSDLEILRDIAATDRGILYSRRNAYQMTYRFLNSLYHLTATPELTVSFTGSDGYKESPIPNDDDQAIRNDVTVKRTNGGSYRVRDLTSPLSVLAPPLGVGIYDRGAVNVNTSTDAAIANIAGWELYKGTNPDSRYTGIHIHLNRNITDATKTATLNLDLGDVINLTTLPTQWYGSDSAWQVMRGYVETLNQVSWDIAFNCTAARPYMSVGVYDYSRYDSADSTLAAGIDNSPATTALSVAFTTARWTRAADDAASVPFTIVIDGEEMSVTAVVGTTSPQAFTVTRATNGLIRAHDAGAAVNLAAPAVYAL